MRRILKKNVSAILAELDHVNLQSDENQLYFDQQVKKLSIPRFHV